MPESTKGEQRGADGADAPCADRVAAAVERLRSSDGLEVRLNEPMGQHTSLGVGGPAAIYAIARSVEGVCAGMEAAQEFDLPLLTIGRGTNLLILDGGFPGIVLHLGKLFSAITVDGSRLVAQSGATLAEVCEAAADAGLSGLEFAAGVPGSVGGAVGMNAGAGAGQMADVVDSIDVAHEDGSMGHCTREQLSFGYRTSCLRDRQCVAVLVTFELKESDPTAVRKAMFEAVERRCRSQPLALGSCGSVFKRPPNDYAGRLLEEAGVKGLRIGGARFSRKHANFIVNEGDATAQDIVDLIEMARRRVQKVSGVLLEEEVCVVGEPLPDGKEGH